MTNTTKRKSTNELAAESFARGYKFSEYEFMKAGGSFGDYYYRVYVRAHNALVKADETAKSNKMAASNAELIARIEGETNDLAIEYLAKTQTWALAEFGRIAKLAASPRPERKDFASYKEWNRADVARNSAGRIVESGVDLFVEQAINAASQHYSNSVRKLAARIVAKELDQVNLTIRSARVGVNLETVFTDGNKVVRAQTIVASGPVQKPHYRYLVR